MQFRGHLDTVWGLDYSSDGKWLASVGQDRTARLWDAETGAVENIFKLPSVTKAVAFSPDSRYIAAGCDDKHVRIWSIATKSLVYTSESAANEWIHRDTITDISFSLTGKELLSGSSDATWKLWGGEDFSKVKTFAGHKVLVQNIHHKRSLMSLSIEWGAKYGSNVAWQFNTDRWR